MSKQASESKSGEAKARPVDEAVVAPELLAEAVRQKANEAGFAGMLAVVGQEGHLKIVAGGGTYTLPEGYDYIVLMLAKPEEGEPTVAWLRVDKSASTPAPVPVPEPAPAAVGQGAQ